MKTQETLKLIFALLKSLFSRNAPPTPTVCDPKVRKHLINVLAREPLVIDYGNVSFIPAQKSKLRVELVDDKDYDLNLFVEVDGQSERLDRKGVRTDFYLLDRFRFAMKTFFEREGEPFVASFIVFKNDNLSEEYHSRRNYAFNLNYADGFNPKSGKSLSSGVVKHTGTGGGGRDVT